MSPIELFWTANDKSDKVEEGGGSSARGDGERKAEGEIKIQEEARFGASSFYFQIVAWNEINFTAQSKI